MKTLFSVILALCLASPVAAQERISDDRRVEVFGSDGNSLFTPTTPFSSVAVAGQNRSVYD